MGESVFAVDGVIRRYDWGSRTAIQQLLGLPVDGEPIAELWFGAHPGDPSPALGTTLNELIAADPVGLLGAAVVAEFGPRLPFLLKVLAAERALSIQVHPTRGQARAGYAAEQGGTGDSNEKAPVGPHNYADDNHKPELLCALTPFEALCGFRPIAKTLALLDDLAIGALGPYRDLLAAPDGLRRAFTALLTLSPGETPPFVAAVTAALPANDPRVRGALLAAEHFPDDIGVVVALLLNHVTLRPGEAIYLGAGNVHAYLRGTGVEIMANSDNVLRCGLTPKHIDVAELLRITDFSELAEPRWQPTDTAGAVVDLRVPVPDFRLLRWQTETGWTTDTIDAVGAGPQLVLCTSGRVVVSAGSEQVELTPGRAAFVPAGHSCSVVGVGVVFVATTGPDVRAGSRQ